jgi:hypothetical protein
VSIQEVIQVIITVVCSVLASSGLWSYIQKKTDKNDAKSRLLVGLAHDRILYLGSVYIERGYITKDEYENLHDYLYKPYEEMGGNGTAKKIMQQVDRLELKNITGGIGNAK